ncbi:uncharacterized protein STEHIDRAFT_143311 [Stereum hirsutum FP-91666 SS1]|uniref:Zn(2)-C6 fungal-type domain-containing protein n=1 Tax=Stereum hirsutum (strain FP-91666) TaxID=721885 RepID=R7RVN2_STEHR|nr:uncharacterized protein STEHIDRAFT_143311 [Stereum hirsutum FP-91666 SS1]EIM79181.1 hypothetical protein STEHIDRAFT_143311 [Stereum hirsutum FP-91666 SS1]
MSSMADGMPYSHTTSYIPAYYPTSSMPGDVHSSGNAHRPDISQRKRPKYTRSKLGCLTCRVKKIKCDETKPSCNRCVSGSRECTWPQEVPRKKSTAKKSRAGGDGRPTTASSSGVSEASTPPTRDNTPPSRRDRYEYGLPSLPPSRRQSDPFLYVPPPVSASPGSAQRSQSTGDIFLSAQHQQYPMSAQSSSGLPVIPEMGSSYHTLPSGDHRLTPTSSSPYMPPLGLPSSVPRGPAYRSDDAHSIGHWHSPSNTSHVHPSQTYYPGMSERHLMEHIDVDDRDIPRYS